MGLGLILLIILVLALVGGIPSQFGYGLNAGYAPGGILGVVLVVVLILVLLGRI